MMRTKKRVNEERFCSIEDKEKKTNKIDIDTFFEKYKPEKNSFQKHSSFDGCMFETFGEELAYVKAHQEKYKDVWTITEEEGELFIEYGFHFVNRIGYFITKNIPLNPNIVVALP